MSGSPAALARNEARFKETWGPAADLMRERGVVLGLPERAKELVGCYRDAGAKRINVALRPPFDWDGLRAWAAEVIAAFA